MDADKMDNTTTTNKHKQTSINMTLAQAKQLRTKEWPKSIKPLARALFQTIQSLAKMNHLLWVLVALGSIHENKSVIQEGHVQKHVANIHLPKRPAQVQSQSKNQPKHNGLESGRVGGNFVIKVLLITTDNNLSLVLLRLDFVHPLAGENANTSRDS